MSKETIETGFDDHWEKRTIEVASGDPAPWSPKRRFDVLGKRVPRLDGPAKASGAAVYSIDVRLPGMLHGRFLRSSYPAATLTSLDLEPARRMPGVKAAIAVAQPGTPLRFAGQEVAAVAADTPEHAEDAVRAIVAKYDPKPFVVDLEKAQEPSAPLVFEATRVETKTTAGDIQRGNRSLPRKGNVMGPRASNKGDVDKAFSEADVIVERTYRTQVQTHTCLETHGVVARWQGDELTVWASTQGIFSVREEMAEALGVPKSKVRVITEYMGGGFGSKFGAGVYGVAAGRLAREAGAPVKLFLDRKEEQLSAGNRPNSIQWIKAGAKKDGTLVALHLISHGTGGVNGGAGTSGPLKNIYECPNVRTEEYDVFTNAGPSSAMRAPGHPQGCFALEATMDELAERLGMDPYQFRMKNDPSPVRRKEFEMGADKFGWSRREALRKSSDGPVKRGMGMAASVWYNTGGTGPKATVTIHRDGSAEVVHGLQDIGTGTRTMVALVAAEELGLPLERVTVKVGDTDYPYGPGSGGSTTTPSSSPAIRRAAWGAKRRALEQAGFNPDTHDVRRGSVIDAASGRPMASFEQACHKLPAEGVSFTADRADNHEDAWKRFINGTQFAEVEVDTETGIVSVKRVVAVHDCGVPINLLGLESQIHGGVIQGVSYALFEDRTLDVATGHMVNPNIDFYKVAGALDVPEIEAMILPVYDGVNNTDTTGIGEPATVPTAAAIANAVSHAIGARIDQIPITPHVVLAALSRAREERS
jgi:CO/xanthine dehydrogenase Mo-binding subunit